MVGWGHLKMHPAQNVFTGFGIKTLREVAFQALTLEGATLKGLYEEAAVIAEGGEVDQKTAR
jgi:hypothetical protein